MCVKSLQLCPALCDSMDSSLLGSSVHGTFQARLLEWVAIPSPGDLPDPGIKPMSPALPGKPLKLAKLSHFSRVRLCATP